MLANLLTFFNRTFHSGRYFEAFLGEPNYQGKRRRSTAGAEGTNTGHENAEGMACVGVRLTAQLGAGFWLRFMLDSSAW